MKQQVFYIHGGDSFSEHTNFLNHLKNCELRDPKGEGSKRWSKKLRENLGEDFELFQPTMPNLQNATYEEWKIWFECHFGYLQDGVVLVGWSLGGMFLLKYLSENKTPFSIRSLFTISAPAGYYELETEPGNDCASFQFVFDNVAGIQGDVPKIVLFHSEDDFLVPYEHVEKLKAALPKAELITFTDRNHFLQEEFPELIEKIKEISREGE